MAAAVAAAVGATVPDVSAPRAETL